MPPNPVPDSKITQQVTQRLANFGIRAPSRLVVATSRGEVTLTGKIQFEHQRHAAVKAAQNVEGVRRVLDRMEIIPRPPRV